MENELREIFAEISEYYESPLRLGSRCESNTYYRVEDLTDENIELSASYIASRVRKVCSPSIPKYIITLPGNYTGLGESLNIELAPPGEGIVKVSLKELEKSERLQMEIKNSPVILVNDVITTARSCLEAHTKITLIGARVLCWACLIDRTFGPGPVPVVAAFTGAPVTLLE
jgi:hypothetical protein